MESFVPSTNQLAVEVYVRELRSSLSFYTALGFRVVRQEPDFAVLAWEDCVLFLDEVADQPAPPDPPVVNVRIMVPDVDRYWAQAMAAGVHIHLPIADREYGLRDFTMVSPDGLGLRFASPLG